MKNKKKIKKYNNTPIKIIIFNINVLLVGILIGFKINNYYKLNNSVKLKDQEIQVRFSPNGDCAALVLNTLKKAKKLILIHAYYFTYKPFEEAILNAHYNGIKIILLVDKSQEKVKYSSVKRFFENGIEVRVDKVSGYAHNKIIIIDNRYILTGSYNWTKNAEKKNSENLLLINNKNLAKLYIENWKIRYNKSRKYKLAS